MTKTLTKGSGWKADFTKLPGIKDGKKIEYSVEEANTLMDILQKLKN